MLKMPVYTKSNGRSNGALCRGAARGKDGYNITASSPIASSNCLRNSAPRCHGCDLTQATDMNIPEQIVQFALGTL